MFNLTDYDDIIRKYMKEQEVEPKKAVSDFIYNLALMCPCIEGFDPSVDFRNLGQEWNMMMSDVRLAQKAEAIRHMTPGVQKLDMI